jgi:hypothetical protein
MKTNIKLILLIFIAALWACEKNDPLADQGTLTGNKVAFNLLAQMPDAAAGDTIVLRNVSWSVDDNIKSIVFHHRGFKVRNYEMKIAIPENDANNTIHNFSATFAEDSILVPLTQFARYPEEGSNLNKFYQTLENAYVIQHAFIIPGEYTVSKKSNQDLVMEMNDKVFHAFASKFSTGLNRRMFVAVFPNISLFSVKYFKIDEAGFFTGDLTPEGFQYFRDNITRDRLNVFVKEAKVTDNTRVTVQTVAEVEGSTATTRSSRVFRVL